MYPRVSLLTVLITFFALAIGQKCYGLDGTALDNTFTPCNPSAKHSGCCATNRSVGADICLDTGLCMATKGEYMGSIWQNGCTDPTGQDKACPKVCPDVTNNSDGLDPVPAWNVQMCDYGTYCCRAINDQKSCCNNATAPRISTKNIGTLQLATLTAVSTSATAASTTTTTTMITATTTPTPLITSSSSKLTLDLTTHSTDQLCSKEKRQTAIVGGAVGGVLGAALIGLFGVMLSLHKKERKQRRLKEHYEQQFSQISAYKKMLASCSGSIANDWSDDDSGEK